MNNLLSFCRTGTETIYKAHICAVTAFIKLHHKFITEIKSTVERFNMKLSTWHHHLQLQEARKKNENQTNKHGLCSCARMAVLTMEEVLCEVLNRKSVIVPRVSYDVRGRPGLLS